MCSFYVDLALGSEVYQQLPLNLVIAVWHFIPSHFWILSVSSVSSHTTVVSPPASKLVPSSHQRTEKHNKEGPPPFESTT